MISVDTIWATLAAICLIPSLYRGTFQDLREFRFSEKHFDSLWINVAYVFVILMYFQLLYTGSWVFAVMLLAFSIVFSLIFLFIGFRFGGGGDWRALIYIAWIAPILIITTLIAAGACGIVQAFYWMSRKDIETPAMYRKIPFALSILCGYLIALILFILT